MGKETVDITLQNQRDMKNLFYRLLKLANANRVELPRMAFASIRRTVLTHIRTSCHRHAIDVQRYMPRRLRATWISRRSTIEVD